MRTHTKKHTHTVLQLLVFGSVVAILCGAVLFTYHFVFAALVTADATAQLEQSISPATVNRTILDRAVSRHANKQSLAQSPLRSDPFHSFIPRVEQDAGT